LTAGDLNEARKKFKKEKVSNGHHGAKVWKRRAMDFLGIGGRTFRPLLFSGLRNLDKANVFKKVGT
jgi:hypothetical protein